MDLYPKRTGWMTVGELKRKIADLPDDAVVVTCGSDHSYDPVGARSVELAKAEYHHKSKEFSEHYDDGVYVQMQNITIVDVLVIGDC